jgi:hypothetical protein
MTMEHNIDLAVTVTKQMISDYRAMVRQFPEFEWKSSGAVCILSDGIAKKVGQSVGGHQLDGNGVDLPSLGWEITAGKNIQKSHRPEEGAEFFWVRRLGDTWEQEFEIRFGRFEPEDFPETKQGKHGSSVKKAIAMAKTKVIYSEKT